jgi:hypothetical protein
MQQGSGLAIRGDTRAVRGILLDLEGVVYVRDRLLPRGFRRRGFLSSLSPTRRAAHADALLGISPGWDFERRWTISTRPQLSLGTFWPIEI